MYRLNGFWTWTSGGEAAAPYMICGSVTITARIGGTVALEALIGGTVETVEC